MHSLICSFWKWDESNQSWYIDVDSIKTEITNLNKDKEKIKHLLEEDSCTFDAIDERIKELEKLLSRFFT